jgi:pimeloyl-ACP methyl ester carboxylesterase
MQFDFSLILPQIFCPVLLIHGENDSLCSLKKIQKAIPFFGSKAKLHIVPHGDHTLSASIQTREFPLIFSWIREKIEENKK